MGSVDLLLEILFHVVRYFYCKSFICSDQLPLLLLVVGFIVVDSGWLQGPDIQICMASFCGSRFSSRHKTVAKDCSQFHSISYCQSSEESIRFAQNMRPKKGVFSDKATVPARPNRSPIRRSRSPRNAETSTYRTRSRGGSTPTRSSSSGSSTPTNSLTADQPPPLSPHSVKKGFGPGVRFAILIDEIDGGALLGNIFDSGSQGFTCSCLPVNRDPTSLNPWLVRKTTEVEGEKVRYRASKASEGFFNERLQGWDGKVEMTNFFKITPEETPNNEQIWTMYFPFVGGGSLSDFLMKLRRYHEEQPCYLPPVFLWALVRAICHWLGYLKYGWLPNQDITQVSPWHSVSHGDLHTGNILLDWTNATSNGGIPKFLLADFGYTRFSVEDRHQLPTQAPFDDVYEIKWFRQMVSDILNESIDPNMPGYDELRDLVENRWPNPPDHPLPRASRIGSGDGPAWATLNLSSVSSIGPDGFILIDTDTTPPETAEELNMHSPLTRFMILHILPATEVIIQTLLDNSLNHIKVNPSQANPADNTWQILREAMPPEPRVFTMVPGDVAPPWAYEIEGYWRWIALDASGASLGAVKEQYVPRDSMGHSTWKYTAQRYGK